MTEKVKERVRLEIQKPPTKEGGFFCLTEWSTACSIAGIVGINNRVDKYLGQERRIDATGQDLGGYTITIPDGFDWSALLNCQEST